LTRRDPREFSIDRVYSNEQAEHLNWRIPIMQSQGVAMKCKHAVAFIFVLIASVIIVPCPLFAHHSSAAYDMEHPVNMKGVVTNMEWGNPHVFIYMDVKQENGSVEQWRLEGNSPNMLVRAGWKKEMIKTGDQLTVNGAPAKNGSKVMRLITLTLPNGQKFDGQGFK
jgi:hypothetical protein